VNDGLMVRRHERHSGMGEWAGVVPDTRMGVIADTLSRRERQVIGQMLQDGGAGATQMLSRARLKAGAPLMEGLYVAGLVNGAGTRDDRGTGNTPDSSWWWLTERGEQVARAVGLPVRSAAA
jgi:hypothetical protein